LSAPQLDTAPRSYKIFSFADTSQYDKENLVKNPFQGNVEGVGDIIGQCSAQARKL